MPKSLFTDSVFLIRIWTRAPPPGVPPRARSAIHCLRAYGRTCRRHVGSERRFTSQEPTSPAKPAIRKKCHLARVLLYLATDIHCGLLAFGAQHLNRLCPQIELF